MTILPQLEKDLYQAARQRLRDVDDPAAEPDRHDHARAVPAARWPRFRGKLRSSAAVLPVLASIIVVLVIGAVALTLRRHHSSPPAGPGIAATNGEILLADGSGDAEFVNPDGSGVHNAPSALGRSAAAGGAAWSPNGKQLAYLAGGVHQRLTLYLVGADGQDPRRLAACGYCQGVSWSPDGSQIAVVRIAWRSGRAASNVWVVNAKTGAMRRITHCRVGLCADFAPELQWSPNGGELLFVGPRKGNLVSLDTVRPDGSHPKTITTITFPLGGGPDGNVADPDPQWSPDGREIAFDQNNAIYIINADGTGLSRLVANGAYPAWSPNGTRLVYATWGGSKWYGHITLWTINADGSGNRLLYRYPPPNSDEHGFWAAHVWSPDGKQIAFSTANAVACQQLPSRCTTQTGAYVINADGTGLHRIGPSSIELAWRPIR
jgi:WD40 repeat protein